VLGIVGRWSVDDQPEVSTRALLDEALHRLDAVDSALRVRLMARLAVVITFDDGDLPSCVERGRALAEAAVATARRLGDVPGVVTALLSFYGTLYLPQYVEQRPAIVREMVQLAETADELELLVEGRHYLNVSLLGAGERDAFDREFATFARLVEALRQPMWQWELVQTRAMVAVLDGRLEEGERLSEQAYQIGLAARGPGVTAHYRYQLFELRYHQGRLHELEPAYRAAVNAKLESDARERLALIYAESDQRAEARRVFEECLATDLLGMEWRLPWASGVTTAAQVCAYLGDRAHAAQLYTLLARYPDANLIHGWTTRCLGPISFYLGLLATTLHHWDDAERHFADALAMTQRLRDRPHEAHVLRAYGEMLVARGERADVSRAQPLLTEAIALYEQMGLAHFAAKARVLLTAARSVRASAPDFPDSLSEREVEVLRLVAAGKSNREVAEVLVISVNTVFQHVRSILNKTGCSNRTEAAAYALRHGLVE
jgi:DNA-binding CsgD family transcriptional regulator